MTRLNYARAVALTASITASSVLSGAVISAFTGPPDSTGRKPSGTPTPSLVIWPEPKNTPTHTADEKAHTNTTADEHAGSGVPHLARPQDYSNPYPDEKTHADASSNEYANLNQHTNANTYRSPDISATTNPHTNSDKVAYADTHAYEYATP